KLVWWVMSGSLENARRAVCNKSKPDGLNQRFPRRGMRASRNEREGHKEKQPGGEFLQIEDDGEIQSSREDALNGRENFFCGLRAFA
ncbi:MAG: hypothetical protein FD161_4931, partial [Limisphaerales bacterium]